MNRDNASHSCAARELFARQTAAARFQVRLRSAFYHRKSPRMSRGNTTSAAYNLWQASNFGGHHALVESTGASRISACNRGDGGPFLFAGLGGQRSRGGD